MPTAVAWLQDSLKFAVAFDSNYIIIFDKETKQNSDIKVCKAKQADSMNCNTLLAHPTLGILISGHEDCCIKFTDVKSNQVVKDMQAHTDSVSQLCLYGEGHFLISASHDGAMRCWDLRKF